MSKGMFVHCDRWLDGKIVGCCCEPSDADYQAMMARHAEGKPRCDGSKARWQSDLAWAAEMVSGIRGT